MNRIFNWTFGSIFRTIGRVIACILIGSIFALILSKSGLKIADYIPLGIVKVSAKTITTTSQSYSIRHINIQNYDEIWTSYVSNGTQTQINTNTYWTEGFRTKLYRSGKFEKNVTYQAVIRLNTTPKLSYNWAQPQEEMSCYGSTSNSNYDPQKALIQHCQFIGVVIEDGNNFTDYYINFIPTSDIETVQFNILWGAELQLTRLNVDSSTYVTTDVTTQDTINQQTNDLINNQNSNTNQIIDNQNQNAQQIIDNQNELLGNKCENIIDLSSFNTQTLNGITFTNNNDGTITINGTATSSFGITFYRPILSSGNYTFNNSSINAYIYDYSSNTSILTNGETNKSINGTYNNIGLDTWINSGQVFNNVIFKPMITKSSNVKPFCKYGTFSSKQDTTNEELNNLNNSINDDDSSGAQNKASEFFGNFTTNTHGLTGIITAPLNAIQSLASSSCSPLVLPLPFVNQNLTLPCMRQIYVDNFGSFMTIYDVITLGIISYWILVRFFALVKDFKNPDHDEIEVMDL